MIREQIYDCIRRCIKAGRKPVLILMNTKIGDDLMKETEVPKCTRIRTFDSIPIEIYPEIKDFLIIDDRSWVDQAF